VSACVVTVSGVLAVAGVAAAVSGVSRLIGVPYDPSIRISVQIH
jgi:hypothetical protein